MCGIIGSINYSKSFDKKNFEWINSKIKKLKHRGPDDEKIWISDLKNIIFGHTKLSIIDLSPQNIQPMHDEDHGIILTFNGEIYNYLELKKKLSSKFKFNTNSDTEVIIKSYLEWGEKFLEKIEGMFALALLDSKKDITYIARDRLGEKPLFYFFNQEEFLFSSEISAFYSLTNLNKKVLNETLLNGFPINRHETLLNNINQVEPGEFLKIFLKDKKFLKEKYWKINFNCKKVVNSKEKEFDKILNSNIEKCLISDVNTCVTLSGGLDSSIVTAVASKQKKIDTFSIVFKNKKFDERKHISKISRTFKTNHHEIEINKYSLEDVISIIEKFDLPILDSSIIPSYILFNNLKKNNYKVALGGDGGDEVFGGYNHYKFFNKINDWKKKYFNFNINFLSSIFNNIDNHNFKGSQYLNFLLNSEDIYKIPFFIKKKIRKKILNNKYFLDVSLLKSNNKNLDIVKQSQYLDLNYTLSQSLLSKLDRCSMLNSVESRSPFLSKEIIEFSFSKLNKFDLISNNDQKIFLKKIGKKYLPDDFVYDRKQGFSFPLIDIVNNHLEMKKIEELLTSSNSIFDKNEIFKFLEMIRKSKIRPELIFSLLNIQIWINKNRIEL